jgi:hypothetical protein
MVEVKWSDGRGPAQRIADRLKPSGGQGDVRTESQPTRVHTTIHFAGQQATSPNNPLPQGKDILNMYGSDAKRRP